MKTKNIIGALAMALLMPAMLLTACSNDKEVTPTIDDNTTKKGYPFQVTINVTRDGDEAPAGSSKTARAHYNGDTKKLEFTEGDKLFVKGRHASASYFAGTLDYVSDGNFSGTITTQYEYTGTADAFFTAATHVYAALLPAGYETYDYFSIVEKNGYDNELGFDYAKAFATATTEKTAKAIAIEQFSCEQAIINIYSNGIALEPQMAILNFTITGLTANTNVTATLTDSYSEVISGTVPTNASGEATFAMGVVGGYYNINQLSLTVGGNAITLASGSKTLTAGKIYNITRCVNAINGQFSVSNSKKVKFSKGNLRYASGTWSFFDNQYDYYTSYSADAWDKFGWSTSATTYGMNTSQSGSTYSGDFVDWGSNSDLQTALGTGWFTLTSDEWTYLFNGRSASTVGGTADGRYAKAKVNDVQGIILFPDTYTHPDGVTAPTGVNSTDATGWNGNNYSSADWTKMESAGCVFLPAAGNRSGSTVNYAGTSGRYWSATPNGANNAYYVSFGSGNLNPANNYLRYCGYSVRLVRQVTE